MEVEHVNGTVKKIYLIPLAESEFIWDEATCTLSVNELVATAIKNDMNSVIPPFYKTDDTEMDPEGLWNYVKHCTTTGNESFEHFVKYTRPNLSICKTKRRTINLATLIWNAREICVFNQWCTVQSPEFSNALRAQKHTRISPMRKWNVPSHYGPKLREKLCVSNQSQVQV